MHLSITFWRYFMPVQCIVVGARTCGPPALVCLVVGDNAETSLRSEP